MQPLAGVRVLSMEQAAALPFMSRHLADLGAEVIRVQSHQRPVAGSQYLGNFRNKQLVGLDLSTPEGPDVFRKLAAECDIVAHNYTSRVMEKYGLDFESIRRVQPRVIYCALTGSGSTGPWRARPLFGPGAEAMSGQNAMMGEADALIPGRPGTITYADNVCGLYLLTAVLGALERRDTLNRAQLIDISLYETGVAHLGPVIAERSLGAAMPTRLGNGDRSFGFQGVVETVDGVAIAVSCESDRLPTLCEAMGVASADDLPASLNVRPSEAIRKTLTDSGVAYAVVQDMRDVITDAQRWRRGCFTELDEQLLFAPVWGGGTPQVFASPSIGADNERVFREVCGLTPSEIDALTTNGTIGEQSIRFQMQRSANIEQEIQRGLMARMDAEPRPWRDASQADQVTSPVSIGHEVSPSGRRRVLEVGGSVAVAYVGKLFADLGWEVVRVERPDTPSPPFPYRWGSSHGGAEVFFHHAKQSMWIETDEQLAATAAEADIVVGDEQVWNLNAAGVTACITPFGHRHDEPWSDLTLQAASGFMSLTGEFDQAPQQLPPFAAQLTGALGAASAILATVMSAQQDHCHRRLDLALVDVLTGFVHLQASRYAATGEVARREGRVKHALRMVPASDGFVYCAPGAVMNVDMRGVATLLNEPRLAEERFQTAEGRMQHWDEYLELMVTHFKTQPAAYWFEKAAELHLTFALVQSVDDLLTCPQLTARGLFQTHILADGRAVTVPGRAFRLDWR